MIAIAIGSISAFVIMQVLVSIIFKWGSSPKSRWLWSFIVANIIALISTWFLMTAYKYMNTNITYGIAGGATFIITQIVLSLIFKSKMSLAQWALLVVIAICMTLFALLGNVAI
jgi:multidrug transporter EmrE-like cation transporter